MFKRSVCFSAILAFSTLFFTSCYGPFKLTKKLHSWNKQAGDKWVREGVFLLLVIVPVYEFAALGDAILFNSIEFWTGSNPMDKAALEQGNKKIVSKGNVKAIMTYLYEKNTLTIDAYKNDQLLRSLRIEPADSGDMTIKNQQGQVLMVSKVMENGSILIEDSQGNMLARYSADEVDKIFALQAYGE